MFLLTQAEKEWKKSKGPPPQKTTSPNLDFGREGRVLGRDLPFNTGSETQKSIRTRAGLPTHGKGRASNQTRSGLLPLACLPKLNITHPRLNKH